MPTRPDPIASAQREATRLLKRYVSAPEEEKTPTLRRLAEILVHTRERFLRDDGTPDWNGRTHPYRAWVREIYSEANIADDDRATIQSAIRYHVGAVLRATLDEDTLQAYGLLPQTPRERSKDRRQNRSALLTALNSREIAGGALLALSTAFMVLTRVDPAEIVALPERERVVADNTLADLEKRVRAIRRRVSAATDAAAASNEG